MNYTPIALILIGLLGVLLHNLIEMAKLNKASNATFSVRQYLKLERFSIIISVLIVVAAVILSREIKELEVAGKYLGFGFLTIGYMGQSLLIFFMGKANKVIQAPSVPENIEEKKDEVS